jgi:hypothetical protein
MFIPRSLDPAIPRSRDKLSRDESRRLKIALIKKIIYSLKIIHQASEFIVGQTFLYKFSSILT